MTEKAEVHRTLIILAAYSFVFSFLFIPYVLGPNRLAPFIIQGTAASLPSVYFWFFSRRVLLSGKDVPRNVHLYYLLVCVPITIGWIMVFRFAFLLVAIGLQGGMTDKAKINSAAALA